MANQSGIANPAPLGLAGFGLTTVLLSLVNAGVLSDGAMGMVLALAIVYGGIAQLLAGMWSFRRGDTFAATAFSSYGAFWLSFYLLLHFETTAGVGAYLIFWGLLTFFLWIGTFHLNRALFFVFLTLWITYVLLAIGEWGASNVGQIGGWLGLLCGLTALYTSAAEVLNETAGRDILPLGKPFAK
ncbi:MAG TPA: acetate uptake transporter [Bacillales bacterium]|nr:acetate uptake transporter [Bacillales bacterium]